MTVTVAGVDLTPYVPRVAAAWAVDSPADRSRTVDGSLVFADVSGFTSLSERLARRGQIGAEELTEVVGSCFTRLLAVAYAEGGGLLKFGGDALLLMFDGPAHAARACRAALGMRSEMRSVGKVTSSVGPVRLRMSQGVHSGELHLFRVGVSHKELLIVGPAASRVVAMEASAGPGEVVISPDTAALVDPSWIGDPIDGGYLLRNRTMIHVVEGFPAVAPAGDAANDGMPAALRAHLLAGGGESEHRQVAMAFVHFDGTDAVLVSEGQQSLAEALHDVVAAVQAAVEAEGVTFLSSDIDADGGKVILTAGVPSAVEDAEGRLLRAVRRIADAGTRLPLRIGVNRGHVFAGSVGPPYRRTFTIMGDAVNLAARLMAKAAPGQVVVSPAVLERSRTAFAFDPLPPFEVKGKAAPVNASVLGEVVGTHDVRDRWATPLFGREVEVGTLVDAVARGGAVVDVVGGVGTGKTRLLEELRGRVSVPVRIVTCGQYEQTTAYFAFRVLLRHVLALSMRATGDTAVAALRAAVARIDPTGALDRVLPLIGDVVDIAVPDNETTRRIDPRFRRDRTAAAVGDLLRAAVAEHSVFGFDDVHWLDDASAEILRRLLADGRESPWTICITRRDGDSGFAPDPAIRIGCGPLDDDDARLLVGAMTSDAPLRPDVVDEIVRRAEGNPLFLEELARIAIRGDDDLPDSLEAVVASQIDALLPAERRLLRYAAVLGDSFDASLFADVVAEDALIDAGAAAARLHGFLEAAGDGRLQFRHRLIRDVAYRALPFRIRQQLHGRAAQVIERTTGARSTERAEVLSLHCFHAHQYEKCWTYARLAGDRAKRKWALAEAVDLYERAVTAARRADDAPGRADLRDVWAQLAQVRLLAGRYAAANDAYDRARKLSETAADIGALCGRHATIAGLLGKTTAKARWLHRGLRELSGATDADAGSERARLLKMLAYHFYERGDLKRARTWCTRALDEAASAGASDALAEAYLLVDLIKMAAGERDVGEFSRRALAIHEERGELDNVARIYNNLGAFAYWQGRWSEALDLYERAKTRWGQTGDLVHAALAASNVAEIFIDQGRLDEASATLNASLTMWRALSYPYGRSVATKLLGRVALRRGAPEEAMRLFADARETAEAYGLAGKLLEIDTWMAECELAAGDHETARTRLAGLSARDFAAGGSEMGPMIHRLCGYAAMGAGDVAGALRAFEAGLMAARERDARFEVALALQSIAYATRSSGHPDHPDAHCESEAVFAELGVREAPAAPLSVNFSCTGPSCSC